MAVEDQISARRCIICRRAKKLSLIAAGFILTCDRADRRRAAVGARCAVGGVAARASRRGPARGATPADPRRAAAVGKRRKMQVKRRLRLMWTECRCLQALLEQQRRRAHAPEAVQPATRRDAAAPSAARVDHARTAAAPRSPRVRWRTPGRRGHCSATRADCQLVRPCIASILRVAAATPDRPLRWPMRPSEAD